MPAATQPPLRLSAVAGASGQADIIVRTRGADAWEIQQVGVTMSPLRSGASGFIYLDGSPVTPFVATGDAPSGDPYVLLSPGQEFRITWTGCASGDVCKATVFYRLSAGPAV